MRNNITKIITSLALIASLIFVIVFATVAWFSSNRQVSATGMSVTAKEEASLSLGSTSIATTGSSGTISPAVAKSETSGIALGELTPLDMFDTSVVKTAADKAEYTLELSGSGTAGELLGELELHAVCGGIDYVEVGGYISYVAVIDYGSSRKLAYYDGVYYYNQSVSGSTAPYSGSTKLNRVAASGGSWYSLTGNVDGVFQSGKPVVKNGTLPMTFYVFVGKPDTALDPALFGETLSISATITMS